MSAAALIVATGGPAMAAAAYAASTAAVETEYDKAALMARLNAQIERVEGKLLDMPQVVVPLEEFFVPGMYLRRVVMPAGALILGHCHKTEHANVVTRGKAIVGYGEKVEMIDATAGPVSFISGVGVRKALLIIEEMEWTTVHPTKETDPERLEAELISKSETFQQCEREIALLREHLKEDQLCLGLQ